MPRHPHDLNQVGERAVRHPLDVGLLRSPQPVVFVGHTPRLQEAGEVAPSLSANITETPATFGISVCPCRVKTDDRRERRDDIRNDAFAFAPHDGTLAGA